MAKVLVYHNFLKPGEKPVFLPKQSNVHHYVFQKLGILYANPYVVKKKHMGLIEFVKRFLVCVILFWRSFFYDVLVLDVHTVGLIMGGLLLFRSKPKVLILHFNLLRRRRGFWLFISRLFFKRIDGFIMHSQYDIKYTAELYKLSLDRFTFYPYVRKMPTVGTPEKKYLPFNNEPYILSYGVNARDYKTFLAAVNELDLKVIVVAREHNLTDLVIPENVRVFYNIPLKELDKLVSKCMFTVFTFDGSELSCGQISIVTSLMLHKPIICTECTAVENYVTDEVNGLLVKIRDVEDVRNKIVKLADSKDLQNKLSAGAKDWAMQNTNPSAIQFMVDNLITTLVG